MGTCDGATYAGYPCCQLSNGTVELFATTSVGPRLICYRFVGEDNILGECPEAAVTTDLGEWKPYGGHRLWHAPESIPRTYVPDTGPVECRCEGGTLHLAQPVEEPTGILKEMAVSLEPEGSQVTVVHKLTNQGLWPVQLAPWALTIMRGGGTTIIPQEPYISHDDCLLPARPLVLWHYTDLSDPRFAVGKRFICLSTNDALEEPQKIGVANKQGWAAYFREGTLFVKLFGYQEGFAYPDEGCNCETYTAGPFMELETVGPMHELEPGESAVHEETWHLFRGIDVGASEESLEAALEPVLAQIGKG